jgi:hypothetical protein
MSRQPTSPQPPQVFNTAETYFTFCFAAAKSALAPWATETISHFGIVPHSLPKRQLHFKALPMMEIIFVANTIWPAPIRSVQRFQVQALALRRL